MINHQYKYLFLHIEKCGGNTVRDALGLPHEPTGGHIPLEHKSQYFKHDPKDYFKFTFVRNPWDRMISTYAFYNKPSPQISFKEYITTLLNRPVSKDWRRHRSCYDYIFSENAKITIDFIGKIENLHQDFNTVCDNIGIPQQQQLPHKNKSKHKHYTEYYDDETREIVAEKYAKDIDYFGYKFGE